MTKTKKEKIFGYKVFNSNWICRGFQFELGKTYKIEGELKICNNGFHYCNKLINCFNYYDFDPNNKVALVEILGDIQSKDDKSCTNKVKIIKEINWSEVLNLVNIGENNTGKGNIGNFNSGSYNSGNRNSGNYNSGHKNSGHKNSGHSNSGHKNSGHKNSGHKNSGHSNSGYKNSGNFNLGDRNSGSYNSGDYNSGFFNTNNNDNRYKIFDLDSDVSYYQFIQSEYNDILLRLKNNIWIPSNNMNEHEKENNPHYKIVGGCLKVYSYKEMWLKWWSELNEGEKEIIKAIPNFDEEKFYGITGIRI